jgi:lipoprotein-anchoring transpeptidase ErfK/SrfK
MRYLPCLKGIAVMCCLTLTACTGHMGSNRYGYTATASAAYDYSPSNYTARIPQHVATREKAIVVYPREHAWGAYGADGNLVRGGIATAGGNFCEDTGRPCRTSVGTFRINSLGEANCKSSIYPKPKGGGLMPYCMFFNGSQSLHGSPDNIVVDNNVSHGCVRMRIPDAEWVRYDFARVGTKVIVNPY